MKAIISGRYVLVHGGHIKTIRREAARFDTLYVYIVQNEDSQIPSWWGKEMIDFCTMDMPNVITILDPCHFGYATSDDLARLPEHDVFLCGNPDVADHLEQLGVAVERIKETEGYSTTDLKEGLLREALVAWRKDTGK